MEEKVKVKQNKKSTKKNITLVVNEYPQDTQEIYVCGNCEELGNWDSNKAIKMIPNDKGEFELVLKFNGVQTIEYKYLNHCNWDTVECGHIGNDVDNHSFTTNKNKIVFDKIVGFKL